MSDSVSTQAQRYAEKKLASAERLEKIQDDLKIEQKNYARAERKLKEAEARDKKQAMIGRTIALLLWLRDEASVRFYTYDRNEEREVTDETQEEHFYSESRAILDHLYDIDDDD